MRTGGKRGLPRAEQTIRHYLGAAHPFLVDWSHRYHHLREVTRDDIHAIADQLTGLRRKRALVALRSIFRFCKQTDRVFTDPATHMRPTGNHTPVLQPIQTDVLQRVVEHASTPASRLLLALAAVHAARPITIRQLQLDYLDLANQRVTIAGHSRRIDPLTARLAYGYLTYRKGRWPHTSNAHLFVSERTAHGDQPVSQYWIGSHLKGTGVTLNQIRMDRQLEEAPHPRSGCAPPGRRFRHQRTRRHHLRQSCPSAHANQSRGHIVATNVLAAV